MSMGALVTQRIPSENHGQAISDPASNPRRSHTLCGEQRPARFVCIYLGCWGDAGSAASPAAVGGVADPRSLGWVGPSTSSSMFSSMSS